MHDRHPARLPPSSRLALSTLVGLSLVSAPSTTPPSVVVVVVARSRDLVTRIDSIVRAAAYPTVWDHARGVGRGGAERNIGVRWGTHSWGEDVHLVR